MVRADLTEELRPVLQPCRGRGVGAKAGVISGRNSNDCKDFVAGMNLGCLRRLLLEFAEVGPAEGSRREEGGEAIEDPIRSEELG